MSARKLLPPSVPDRTMRAICVEACDGVPHAQPTHPRLRKDVENALFLACSSPTFRAAVADIGRLFEPTEASQ